MDDNSTTRGQVYDLLRRRHIRADLTLTFEDGVYRYRGQSALAPSLRTDLTIYRDGRRWVITREVNGQTYRV
jgi:hypothetical protein